MYTLFTHQYLWNKFKWKSVNESKIQGHLSYQVCFCIKTVVNDYRVIFLMSTCVYIFSGPLCTHNGAETIQFSCPEHLGLQTISIDFFKLTNLLI
jgi:hypothetical protein